MIHQLREVGEYKELINKVKEFTIERHEDNLQIIVKRSSYTCIINTTSNHPFRCPIISINNKPYNTLRYLPEESLLHTIYKYISEEFGVTYRYPIDEGPCSCLCCDYLLNHWMPTVTLATLIEEVDTFMTIRKKTIDVFNANIIKKHFLHDDIDIESFL